MTEPTQTNYEDLLEAYREAMRHVAATVYAVTTGHAGERHGILATAVNSLSFDPPSLLVCINQSASLHEPMNCTDQFAVNVLGMANRDVADQFTRERGEGRFGVGDWEEVHGVPVLASAQSSFVCRCVHRHEFGTHTIFIGELLAAKHSKNAAPLTYYDRHFIDISEAPESAG
ncbi:flavin reductase (DIM6/NTAB) family NADH-FMN oxidoreductase RutF [Altererythrobacter atlanticus]|uniref:4-nitrophenol 4-monooxygenase/4-nitrocatechol 2-monooxygenase, reductase component n=1 Tax=Croceibacterium atlanticum TaxID=1267766 RepID=A0A0F7KPK2_9SPHN|nr:flavin reductase family protein [Croceibacterium atlanticum]AKH41494.1 4-nitrophenol 4-monooxygenase/4-nitrocatechol 2-monooxygenase, reductase component [Croceibacterium atlanticum]MBB5732956.1 flavin reductase (DIM6/NTAB) family NADH-FMN oxidoreductase RutF [Croceibacterium atlanticum]